MGLPYHVLSRLIVRGATEWKEHGVQSAWRSLVYMIASISNGRRHLPITLFGDPFYVRPNQRKLGVGGFIYSRRDRYEQQIQPYFVTNNKAFIDVGANFGYWSRYVHSANKSEGRGGWIIAIEPVPENIELLKKNIAAAGHPERFVIVEGAVADFIGTISLARSNDDPGSTFVSEVGEIASAVTTLDDIYVAHRRPVGLIKVDVEGFEVAVLRGARGLLTAERPRVICEVIERYLVRARESPESLVSTMHDLGYSGRRVLKEGGLSATPGYTGDGDYVFDTLPEAGGRSTTDQEGIGGGR